MVSGNCRGRRFRTKRVAGNAARFKRMGMVWTDGRVRWREVPFWSYCALFALIAVGMGSGVLFWQASETEETVPKADVSCELALVSRRSTPKTDVPQTTPQLAFSRLLVDRRGPFETGISPGGTGHRLANGLCAPLRL